ncbi:Uncharacterized protein APZ42_019282 [Daphnia magna]|uniref:Transmembrane protein n=1 Tax=Daphnia magna TaxID=35525 RepID=A0A164YG16_9CRUS|nr:Uncharacterized protein APZ42_019282 [Daphnia magna]
MPHESTGEKIKKMQQNNTAKKEINNHKIKIKRTGFHFFFFRLRSSGYRSRCVHMYLLLLSSSLFFWSSVVGNTRSTCVLVSNGEKGRPR